MQPYEDIIDLLLSPSLFKNAYSLFENAYPPPLSITNTPNIRHIRHQLHPGTPSTLSCAQ